MVTTLAMWYTTNEANSENVCFYERGEGEMLRKLENQPRMRAVEMQELFPDQIFVYVLDKLGELPRALYVADSWDEIWSISNEEMESYLYWGNAEGINIVRSRPPIEIGGLVYDCWPKD